MRTGVVVALIGLVALNHSISAEPDPLAAKQEKWQKQLEATKFSFAEDKAGVMYSLSQCVGDYKIHMIYDLAIQPQIPRITFRFERAGQELLTINGHDRSVFQIMGTVLYFAHFPTSGAGCTVTAHDLTTGKRLWETSLDAVGYPPHSIYKNEVTMHFSWLSGPGNEAEGSVWITGRESIGDYIEVLDCKTGKRLAHKVYRFGSAAKQPQNAP